MKIATKKGRGGDVRVGGPVGGGGGGPVRGVQVYVYEELKLLRKCKKKVGGRGFQLVARLGVVGDVQYWVCKPRIEGIVICT